MIKEISMCTIILIWCIYFLVIIIHSTCSPRLSPHCTTLFDTSFPINFTLFHFTFPPFGFTPFKFSITSLHFTSPHFTSLHLLHFTLLHYTSIHFTLLHFYTIFATLLSPSLHPWILKISRETPNLVEIWQKYRTLYEKTKYVLLLTSTYIRHINIFVQHSIFLYCWQWHVRSTINTCRIVVISLQ
jgi:hypothetical protein